MNPCIYYHPEAYTTSGPKLMGRHAAGESFLRGFLQHARNQEFWLQVQKPEHARHFFDTASAMQRTQPVKAVRAQNLAALAEPGLVYHPGPGIGEHAWQRAVHGHAAWSLCGITHTTSSAGAMDSLVQLITAPVQPWDAVICTSTAVKTHVERLLQAQVDHLAQRLGATRLVLPQLPVIPLGIHTQDFAFDAEDRAQARRALGVDENALVVLFMGRLSFHAKAHPLAMYQALQQAAQAAQAQGRPVVLVECGWHANEFIAKAYADAAQQACPAVRVVTLDGRDAGQRRTAWAGADVFCSLSDNIQETFGIVPIEAMAAGLPVVVSDWDGYRDTVRDGVDGFRIPTVMPQAGLGTDLAWRHAVEIDTYDMYCGHTCSLVAVDVQATAKAFERLFTNPALRQQMGQAGRERARSVYDWKPIIRQYEQLWAELTQIRQAQAPHQALAHPWPARLDPFHAFAAYPTQVLTPETLLVRVDADAAAAIARTHAYRQLAMVEFAKVVLPNEEEVSAVLHAASSTPMAAKDLVALIPPERQAFVLRSLGWLLKLGVLAVFHSV
jgi:glycosyltransferase involved in cell wall biosynthesis